MWLTFQDVMEIGQMQARINSLHVQAFSDYRFTYDATVIIHQEELTDYKIKLENLFARTDEKEMSNE